MRLVGVNAFRSEGPVRDAFFVLPMSSPAVQSIVFPEAVASSMLNLGSMVAR